MKKFTMVAILLAIFTIPVFGQVGISTDGSQADANAMLDVKSSDKGFLMPRVDLSATTFTNPALGLSVFNTSSAQGYLPGYYFWNGTSWERMMSGNPAFNTVVKTVSGPIAKTDGFVIASGDITLSLPHITTADNGLLLTVKNNGSYMDLIKVCGYNVSEKIDNRDTIWLTRYRSMTVVAYGGKWLISEKDQRNENIYDVGSKGSFNTIAEAVAFLGSHMNQPAVLRIDGGTFDVSSTITIDLEYPLTIEGLSYGSTTLRAASGLTGTMFNCESECYFKMLDFSADASFNSVDAITLSGSEYYEVKDASFEGFSKQINLTGAGAEAWLFEMDFMDAASDGIVINGATTTKISECDFTNCSRGIHMLAATNPVVSVNNCGFYNGTGGKGIVYVPASFRPFNAITLTNNTWNGSGTFISGFDFSSNAQDTKAFIFGNSGISDKKPSGKINVLNNTTPTTITGTWTKAQWTNTNSINTKLTIGNNRITSQTSYPIDLVMTIAGNLSCGAQNQTVNIAIVKNGNSATRYGETSLRVTNANQPFQFSTVVLLQNVAENDYFEIWVNTPNNQTIFQDINWYTSTQ